MELTKHFRPQFDDDWAQYQSIFTQLYIVDDQTLENTRRELRDRYNFDASEKQCKNQIKKWGLRKYLKGNEAQQIVNGTLVAGRVLTTTQDPEEARKKAERSLKRKRARETRQNERETSTPGIGSTATQDDSSALIHRSSSIAATASPRIAYLPTNIDTLLFNLRKYTHEAYVSGHWDSYATTFHHKGRQAARSFSADLTAGRSLFDKGKNQLALNHWQRARSCFANPELLNTWYHETPIRLLFEIGRMVHTGHRDIAVALLQAITASSMKHLDENDPRYALFNTIGDLNVDHLRELHLRAARCLYEGMASRFEKRHHLRYEVRLNRALDLLWFDAKADLSEWLPSIQEVDEDLGPHNAYSIYFLLLHAYRSVAQGKFKEADGIGIQIDDRLAALNQANGNIDYWRVGLAYRRLGRQLYAMKRYEDARRTLSKALKYVRDTKDKSAVLIEICQYQVSMAEAQDDEIDVLLWTSMLEQVEQASQARRPEPIPDIQPQAPQVLAQGPESNTKRRRLDIPTNQELLGGVEGVIHGNYSNPAMGMNTGEYVMRENLFNDQNGMVDAATFMPEGAMYNEPILSPGTSFGDFESMPFQTDIGWPFGGMPNFDVDAAGFTPGSAQFMPFPPATSKAGRSMTA